MRRRNVTGLSLFLVLLFILPLFPATANGSDPPKEASFRILRADAERMTLLVEIPPLRIESLRGEPGERTVASFPGASWDGGPGDPAVPALRRLIALPTGASATVRALRLEEERIDGVTLAAIPEEEGDRFAGKAKREKIDPAADAFLGNTASLHGLSVAPLLLRPVRYDPEARTLLAAKRMRVEIDFHAPPAGKAPAPVRPVPPSIDRFFRSEVLGYGAVAEREVREGTHLVIAPNDPALLDSLQPWLHWRARKGGRMVLSVIPSGTTASAGSR